MKILFRFIGLAGWLGLAIATHADDLASIFTNVQARAAVPQRPSIILIEGHGLGFGDLSCYGQTNFETPNLDRIAGEGIRFNHYLAGTGTNFEGQNWLLTGNQSPGVGGESVAQMLLDAGYSTAFMGEWLAAGQPRNEGFESFSGFLNSQESANYYADYMWRIEPGSAFEQTPGKENIYANINGKKGVNTTEFFFTMAGKYIQRKQPDAGNHYRPFFLVLNLPIPRSARAGADDFPVASDAPYSDEPWPQAAKNRAALIGHLDADVGDLLDQLKKMGLTDKVVLFFSSSAPPEPFADKRLEFFRTAADRRKASTDDFYAPLMIRWPDHIPAGQVSDAAVSAADFLPTAAQIGLIRPPAKITGQSLLPAASRQKPTAPK